MCRIKLTSIKLAVIFAILFCTMAVSTATAAVLNTKASAWNITEWTNLPRRTKTMTLQSLKGKVIVLYMVDGDTASADSDTAKAFQETISAFAGENNAVFAVIDVSGSESFKKTQKFAEDLDLDIPVGNADSKLAKAYNTSELPWLVVIDDKGAIKYSSSNIDTKKMISFIDDLLAQASKLGRPAPELTKLKYVKGSKVEFKQGNVYVVEFWATWCGPCRSSIPHLTKTQAEYKDKGLVVLGISTEKENTVKKFVESMGSKMEYNVAVDSNRVNSNNYMSAFGQRGIPHAFIIGKDGTVVWHGHPMSMDDPLKDIFSGKFNVRDFEIKARRQKAKYTIAYGYYSKYQKWAAKGNSSRAKKYADLILKSNEAPSLYNMAWNIANYFKPEDKRDLPLALTAAQKAMKLTSGKDVSAYIVLARVMFVQGNIEGAVKQIKKGLAIAEDRSKPMLNRDLKKYQKSLEKKDSDK